MRLRIEELESVVAVAKRRSFRAAALDVGVSPTVLSQRIAAVEAKFGVRLFNRTTRSVSLTEAGTRFISEVGPAVARIHNAIDMVNDHRSLPAGVLRINMSVGAARRVFSPLLIAFSKHYPEIEVDLVTEDRPIDIVAEGYDAGVRPNNLIAKDMIALRLEPDQHFSIVGSPAYMDGRQPPLSPQDLLDHECIRSRMPSGAIDPWEFDVDRQTLKLDVRGRFTLDDGGLMLEAALSGVGLAYLSDWWTTEAVSKGKLQSFLGGYITPSTGLSLYYPSRRYQPAALLALTRFITDRYAGNRRHT
ncbi:LysR family transcriptional regulator [Pararhizobium sp. DWP3-4]|uniref:LysR family transcriptional regulator n=1 Tax=Pararhizobium sp. DWP3-4 TaxID=2804565 RepID=UPI003CF03A20